ncbi:unnamed protein product [Adineta ricciae]|uniref:Homeobox domain-containing protein n=1 Tax=Adineta ricciae TaxID=249248 RepID=A0A813Q7B8_ADIRI|nr:unnamed protein product [Adineta ricciae]CAF1357896.1 unnamed protein product [Adineta ricciae]
MDPYYSSPSSCYYHPSSCASYESSPSFLSDPYTDPYSSYPSTSTSYYYSSSYTDQTTSSPIVFYNNSATNIHNQPNYPAPIASTPTNMSIACSTSSLNTTFESAPPPGRRRRQRTIFSKDQVDILDQVFEKNQYPDFQLREQLSERLDVPEARIQVWFKNRRSRAGRTKSKY